VASDYSVYILQNPDGKKYIGVTEDVQTRVKQHNTGVSTWTRYRGPWLLVWQRDRLFLNDARKLEMLLKRQHGGDGLYRLTGLSRSGT